MNMLTRWVPGDILVAVADGGDQSGTGQDRDDADIDAAPGEPFHSAALQQEIGMSQEGWSSSERPRF